MGGTLHYPLVTWPTQGRHGDFKEYTTKNTQSVSSLWPVLMLAGLAQLLPCFGTVNMPDKCLLNLAREKNCVGFPFVPEDNVK